MKIIGIGDNVIDAYLHEKKLYPGGNSVNVPVLAKRFGAEAAAYIGILGNDEPGQHFLSALREEGLDVSRVRMARGVTAQNYIHNSEDGDRHFVGNNGSDVVEQMLGLLLVQEDFRLIEKYSLAYTSVHSFIDYLLPSIARRAPLALDFSDGYHYRNIPKLCPLLRFAFFSGGDKSPEEVKNLARFALDSGAGTVVVTSGERGSYMLEDGREHTQGIVKANVVDTLGAGDAFIAAFLTAYSDSDGDLPHAAAAAAAFASRCCDHYGAFGHAMAAKP
jgi:fructoselysine 6-kinase